MMQDEIITQLREICSRHGVDELASCSVESLTHEETVARIQEILSGAQSILVLLKKIPDGMINHAHEVQYQHAAIQTFDDLCAAAEEMVSCLQRQGIPVAWPGRQKTPHQKQIAVRAGLGAIGDCKLLISFRHGIDVHLETVLVGEDIKLPATGDIRFKCDSCGLCVTACPAKAIAPGAVNRDKCIGYRRANVTKYKERQYCGICMKVCPQRTHPQTE
jgi:epoxyqueuosine reductase QueG